MDFSSIFVIVPAFNEAQVISETLTTLIRQGYTVVVVDDASRDATPDILRQHNVFRVRHPINLGQGAALETGMEFARRHKPRAVVHFDADGQHDYQQIPDLLQPILQGHADVALGSRFLRAEDRRMVPRSRRLLLKAGIVVSGLTTGLWLSDTHNGFRALSPKALHTIRLRETGFAHATEILSEIRKAKLTYVEVPVRIKYSDYSRAKGQSPWNALNILIDLILRKVFP